RPISVASRFHIDITTTLPGARASALVVLNDAKVHTAAHHGLHAALGHDALDDDVKVNEAPRLKLGDARVREFATDDATEALHRHRQQSARVSVEISRQVEPVVCRVKRRTNEKVAFGVNLPTATPAHVGPAALGS